MHVADRGGKSFLTSRAIYRVTVHFRLKTYQREKRFLTIFLGLYAGHHVKNYNFFLPSTTSDRGKRSNASLNSNNNNNKEDNLPPKRSLKSTSSEAIGASCASFKKIFA